MARAKTVHTPRIDVPGRRPPKPATYTSRKPSEPRVAVLPSISAPLRHPGGRPKLRPSAYDDTAINIMFDHMVAGVGLEHACKDPRCPDYVEVYRRTHRDQEFASRMLLVRETQQAALVDRTYVIADGATAETWQVARLRIQTIWWGAARLAPKVFGDKSQLNLVVTDALSDRLTAALKRQRELASGIQIDGVAEPMEALPAPVDNGDKG